MSIEGQGHFLTLAQGCVHTKIQTGFSQKLGMSTLVLNSRVFTVKVVGVKFFMEL